ncbi:hypothetical protein HK096_007214 [Nowakowskiella sp. JEL0078]|nr:hypothetical protein HK096_007214 [Nowakowskiella sp. JEL0078]
MSERKVLNKYFPPDFDPAKIPRRSLGKEIQHKVRLMTPFSMRCNTCGDYIYKGKKFNARKERAAGEDYLGLQIWRFYIRCPRCSAEITFKTDPKNTDYVAELGAQRNFEPWRDEEFANEELRNEKKLEEEYNPMRALENRTTDSKREMDILDSLDEIRTKNAMNERVSSNDVLQKLQRESAEEILEAERRLQDEDDQLAKQIFQSEDGAIIRRVVEENSSRVSLIKSISFSNTKPVKKKDLKKSFGIVRKRESTNVDAVFEDKKRIKIPNMEIIPKLPIATYESDDE